MDQVSGTPLTTCCSGRRSRRTSRGVRRRPLAPRGPARRRSARSSSGPRWSRSSTWRAVWASTPGCPSCCRALAARSWRPISSGVERSSPCRRCARPAGARPRRCSRCDGSSPRAGARRRRRSRVRTRCAASRIGDRPLDRGLDNVAAGPGCRDGVHPVLLVARLRRRGAGLSEVLRSSGDGGSPTPSAQKSTARSSSADHRAPPGSLASC